MTTFDLGETFEPFDAPIGRAPSRLDGDEFTQFGFEGGLTLAVRRDGMVPCIRITIDGGTTIWGTAGVEPSERVDGVPFDHHAFLAFFASNWAVLWLERLPASIYPSDLASSSPRSSNTIVSSERLPSTEEWIAFQ